MTLDQLAEIAWSSKRYIWALENRGVPPQRSAEKIFAIAAALGVTPEVLVTDGQAEAGDEVVDEAFFRKYRRMPADAKHRLREILDPGTMSPELAYDSSRHPFELVRRILFVLALVR